MNAPSDFWLEDSGLSGALKVGEKFEISNPDKPAWCAGWFEVVRIMPGRIYCKRVEGPQK